MSIRPWPEAGARPGRAAALLAPVLLALVSTVPGSGGQENQAPQRPPTFRTGTNVIRVDATVTDRSGRPVADLTADDFEIREDGKPQAISSFKFVAADGEPSDDRSLPIRSAAHAASEAARDDVRTFLIFWDEYHIEEFVSALRGREALTQAVLSQFGPTDLVAVMDPLTPINAIEFTRDRRALADQVHTLRGRMGVYFPPRSAVEEAHMRVVTAPRQIEVLRTQVTVTAIKAAAAHLGTLSQGRKTLIVVSERLVGFPSRGMADTMSAGLGGGELTPRDLDNMAIDIVRAANDSNTAVHVVDPRGLLVNSPVFSGPFETIAAGTGGDLVRSNDISAAFAQMVRQVSALYLLGYTREMPVDGRFHEIKVRVKRSGADVRARAGYWAPRAEDVETARLRAAAAVLPPDVAEAFSTLPSPGAPQAVDLWVGTTPLPDGRFRVAVAWAPRSGRADPAVPVAVSASIGGDSGEPDRPIEPAGTTFEVQAGTLKLAVKVMDAKGEVIDRETRSVPLARAADEALTLATPVLYRIRTPAELRALLAAEQPPIHAGRVFTRTDRLIVRVSPYGRGADAATVAARLIDRRGAILTRLTVGPAPGGSGYQLDLPLSSVAAGEFAIVIEAARGESRVEALVPFRVVR